MKFNKYPSIINEHKIADIEWWMATFPKLEDAIYLITEKIDGANFQIVYLNGKLERFGKRNSFIGNDSKNEKANFFGFREVIKDNPNFDAMNKYFIEFSNKEIYKDIEIILYGEIYGSGIQKRVYYGPNKYLKFYDIKIGENFMSGLYSMNIFKLFNMYVPLISIIDGIKNAIVYKNEFTSKLTPIEWNGNKEENIAEGIVIKPLHFDVQNNSGSRFIIKSKPDKFKDKENKKRKEYKPMEGSLKELVDNAKTYVNENRLLDLISKLGPLNDNKQIGLYMKEFSKDWQDEFKSDYTEELMAANEEYSKSDIKNIFKIAGKNAIILIKNYINNEQKKLKQNFLNGD